MSLVTILCSLEHRDWSLPHKNACATFIRNPFQGATWFHKSYYLVKGCLFSSAAGHTKNFTQLKDDQSAIIWATVSHRWAYSAAWLSDSPSRTQGVRSRINDGEKRARTIRRQVNTQRTIITGQCDPHNHHLRYFNEIGHINYTWKEG